MYQPMTAIVRATERLSPHFIRVWFGGEELSALATPEKVYDQRIKLLFPSPGHSLPALSGENWYIDWLATPEESRGDVRTYSIREVRPADPYLAVDFVVHEEGVAGPWAAAAQVGEEILIIGPTSAQAPAGIEFAPQSHHSRLLVAGDESAVPAMLRIAEDLSEGARGLILCEVPAPEDVLQITVPQGVELRWLPRSPGQQVGEQLIPALLAEVGQQSEVIALEVDAPDDSPVPVWETAVYSAAGEDLSDQGQGGSTYFWIAGESSVVTGLRRALVREHGIARQDVAFMGYWKRGVSLG